MIAGIIQATAGSRIPDWTGNKDNPVGLGLLTILLSLIALGAAASVRGSAETSAGRRVTVALALLIPGALCFSTVGRLWYVPGALMIVASGMMLASGGVRDSSGVIQANWTRGLVSLLGAFEFLMAISAAPVSTMIVGIGGAIALMIGPWLTSRMYFLSLLLLGTLPFAILTWWSLITPVLAIVALTIGLTILRDPVLPPRPQPGRATDIRG